MAARKLSRQETLRAACRLLAAFVQWVEVKRAMAAIQPEPQINFWRILAGGLTNLGVIEWCKLFGASRSNKLHWKNVFSDREAEFRSGLLAAVGLDEVAFLSYWKELKAWRDTDAAHSDPDAPKGPRWPHFDVALKAAGFYYAWLVQELGDENHFMWPAHLDVYRRVFRTEADAAATLAMQATANLPASKW